MIRRSRLEEEIRQALGRSPVVVMTGPRQSGKTTLARQFVDADSANYFDLEDPLSLARLEEPMTALGALDGLTVIDEIQRRPDLFPVLRVLVDQPRRKRRFLILGSASGALLRQSSESLAGRAEFIDITPFRLTEVGLEKENSHWLRGGFPPSFLASDNKTSFLWRRSFVRAFLEQDLPGMGVRLAFPAMFRFWSMLAHYHGQIWKAADPARAMGVSEPTVRRYLDILTGSLMIRQLKPWHENLAKRQVRSPKIYFTDSGLLHAMLGIRTPDDLLRHPRCGASWEGYALEEIVTAVAPDEVFFWATHNGAELDLLAIKDGKRLGFEFKRADAPKMTPSMRIASEDLALDSLTVVYPGARPYSLGRGVSVVPLRELISGRSG
ncbi:ATP-binding protein [Candidatus Fermentibacteria bacterium]|nr:ATP-binding protein [Candidatus Fermentibacteria bacterium]